MKQDKVIELKKPEETFQDVLTEVLRRGAQEAIIKAVQGEFKMFMDAMSSLVDEQGRRQVVCNGRTDERSIQTPLGSLKVSVPRCKDKRKAPREEKVKFTSALLPPYLKRTKQLSELLPLLYLKGLSTGDFAEALSVLLGKSAPGLSPSTISRMTREWQADWEEWQQRNLSGKEYVYFWADGVYFQARLEEAKQCVLVIVGALENGTKEVVAIWDGYRESTASWTELMLDLQKRGLKQGPRLAVGDGALGFWNALSKVFGSTRAQRCWLHKTGNVLNKLPKGIQAKAKSHLHQIWMAETKVDAEKAFDFFLKAYNQKYPKAAECLAKDRDVLLTFYDFPAEHWAHIRTTNPIESTFATVRQRTYKTKNCLSRATMLTMVFKLCLAAEKRWRKLNGSQLLADLIEGVNFVDGIRQEKKAA